MKRFKFGALQIVKIAPITQQEITEMVIKARFYAALFMACAGATPAYTQPYADVTYISARTNAIFQGDSITSRSRAVGLFIGTAIHRNLAVEGLIGTGLGGTEVKVNGTTQTQPVTGKIDYLAGIFLKPQIAVTNDLRAFARLGYITGKTTASNASNSASSTESDWSYGVGMNYRINKSLDITASWMSLYDESPVKVDAWMIGAIVNF